MYDVQIGLDMNLSGLTNYYTQQDTSSKLLNYYTKEESGSNLENVSRMQVSGYTSTFSSDRFWHVRRLSFPSDGHHAIITMNACNGGNLNFSGALNFGGYNITNYQMTAHIYTHILSQT